MPEFEKGQHVTITSDKEVHGVIDFVHTDSSDRQMYDVQKDGGAIETVSEVNLRPRRRSRTAWNLLAQNELRDYHDFSVATTVHKVNNTANNTVSSLRASRTLFKPYQYKPLIKFLKSDIRRILVADEVGLGKTIEAGHIMLEMRGRKQLSNSLIVCPKSLHEHWKRELRQKFSFDFKIYGSKEDLCNDIEQEGRGGDKNIRGIVNYAKCKRPEVTEVLSETGYMFDLIICDESHRLRNSDTDRYSAFDEIMKHAEAAIFLTATPIMNEESDLFNQIRLLDRDRYPNLEVFKNAINQNRPFIRALRALNKGREMRKIADDLHNEQIQTSITIGEEYRFKKETTVAEEFGSDRLYERARERMIEGENTPETRVKVQRDLSELNLLNHVYTRTRKRDVITDGEVASRNPHRIRVSFEPEERRLYQEVANQYQTLGVIQKKRMISSSIVAYHTPREKLKQGNYDQSIPDSKFDAFHKVIDKVVRKRGKKIIVFSTFKDTLWYLAARLRELGIGSTMVHGNVQDRKDRFETFRQDDDIKVLLLTQVGQEGIDLQFCDVVVNYDLPWNPMRIEQRIGRVDRIGQTADVVNIYAFTINDTIEEKVYDRLLDKIDIFKEALGDIEDVLSEDDSTLASKIDELRHEIYKEELTEQEQDERIDEVKEAFIRKRRQLEDIENNLTNAIVHDRHVENEISSIVDNKRYLTPKELKDFIKSLFHNELTTLRLQKNEDRIYTVDIPSNDRLLLFEFIEEYMDDASDNPELYDLYSTFKRKHFKSRSIPVTFDQQVAYEKGGDIEHINSYHPLVNAASNLFKKRGYHLNQAYRLGIENEKLDSELDPGHYLLVVYRVSISRTDQTDDQTDEFIHAALLDLTTRGEPEVLDNELAEGVLGTLQEEVTAPENPFELDEDSTEEFMTHVRTPIADAIRRKQKSIEDDKRLRLQSSSTRRARQLRQFYDNQIERRRELLQEGRGIEDILTSEIDELEEEKETKIQEIENIDIDSSNDIISVNHLEVF